MNWFEEYEVYGWMADMGLPSSESMSHVLSADEQRQARQAAIASDRMSFNRFASLAISRATKYAADPSVHQMIVDEGGEVRNGCLYLNGEMIGTLRDCFLDGTLGWYDE